MKDFTRPDVVLGVVGAGTMGRGIAQVAASGGMQVLLADARPEAVADAREFIGRMLNRAAEKGAITAAAAAEATKRVSPVASLQELSGCDVVIEAVAEDLAIKQEVFRALEAIVGDECILASNTSAIPITSIAAGCRRPQRVAGTHFFNPVPLMKLVEVIDGLETAPEVCDALVAVGHRMGREPVRCTDFAGFLAGNIGRGYTLEAARIVEEGIAGFAEIDSILRDVVGFPMGPFQLIDNNGLDVVHRAMETVYESFYQEPYFRPSPLLRQRVAAGHLGRKSGRGFYAYENGKALGGTAEPQAGAERPKAVWVSPVEHVGAGRVRELLQTLEIKVETGARPSAAALCLVTPVGEDATTTALRQNLDPARTVAVDALFGLAKRRTIMGSPAVAPGSMREAAALLSSDGVPVTTIKDSPGFVAQRVVAMIVNIGWWIAHSGFATSEDVDKAARFGLGYPKGPYAFTDALGVETVRAILDAMQARSGDPRYRPSAGLARACELNASSKAK